MNRTQPTPRDLLIDALWGGTPPAAASSALRETSHLLLMRSLAESGNVARVLAAYERLRMTLREELGTAPETTLQSYYLELLG